MCGQVFNKPFLAFFIFLMLVELKKYVAELFSKFKNSFCKTNMRQKAISHIGPSIWNSLPDSVKRLNTLNTFKHNVKKHYLTWLTNTVFLWICVSVFICMFKSPWVYLYIRMHIYQCIFLWLIHSQVVNFLLVFYFFSFVFIFSVYSSWPEGPQWK